MLRLDRHHRRRHPGKVSNEDRRQRRKTRSQERTALVWAVQRACLQRGGLHSLAQELDVPVGTLRSWLTYPPTRRSVQQDRARTTLTRLGHLP